MTEALEWLIEHQDDSDNEEDDFLCVDRMIDTNIASPSSSISAQKKSLKDACLELFETGNPRIRLKYTLFGRQLELKAIQYTKKTYM